MAKISGNEIRPGMVIEHDGPLRAAAKAVTVKPGKGPAYDQVELKNLLDGRKLNQRFGSDARVEETHVARRALVLEVTDAHIKGRTAASSYQGAKIENGLKTQVPPFIAAGEKAVVSTDDVSCLRRAE